MSSDGKKLAVGIFCVDWRLHQKEVRIVHQVRDHLEVDVIDVISLPGPDGFLKRGKSGERKTMLAAFQLLIGAHKPQQLVIVGHYNCAGNPVDDAEHDRNVADTVTFLKKQTKFRGPIVGLNAVRKHDQKWSLKEVVRG